MAMSAKQRRFTSIISRFSYNKDNVKTRPHPVSGLPVNMFGLECKICNVAPIHVGTWPRYYHEGSIPTEHLVEHLGSHDIAECKFCGEWMTKRGMPRHQKSEDCIAQSRKFAMREKGYEVADLAPLDTALDKMKRKMEQHVKWDDLQGFLFCEQQHTAVRYKMLEGLGCVIAMSDRGPTYSGSDGKQTRDKGLSWKKENWLPWETAHFLFLLDKHTKKHNQNNSDSKITPADFLSDVVKYIEGDAAARQSMIGILELATEA